MTPRAADQPLPQQIRPMLATAGELPASDAGWSYEFKWDGIRAICYIDGGRMRAMSRGEKDLTRGFPELAELEEHLRRRAAVLDGEIVAFDDAGRPSFGRLQRRLNLTTPTMVTRRAEEVPASYLVFDVLYLDGRSLLDQPYDARREVLESLALSGSSIATAPIFTDAHGADVLAASRAAGMEGVVAKRRDSLYRPGARSPDWRKVKIVRTQEVVIGGWTDGAGERAGSLGALLLGIPESSDQPTQDDGLMLRYVGRVGTGFDAATRRELLAALGERAVERSAFSSRPPSTGGEQLHFVVPELVGEVGFGEWTGSGHLRHPSWRGLRVDKDAREVVVES
jgi:bifunctional non-homologous end joining protein LigD